MIGHMKKLEICLLRLTRRFGIPASFTTNVSLVVGANAFSKGLNLIISLIIAKTFSQDLFGLFSIAVTIFMTTSTFSDLGTKTTMVRLYKHHEGNSRRSNAVLLWVFYCKCSILAFAIFLAVFLCGPLSKLLTHEPNKSLLVSIAIVGGGLFGYWQYITAFLQSFNLFKAIAILTSIFAFLRLFCVSVGSVLLLPSSVELLFAEVHIFPLLISLVIGFYVIKDKMHFRGSTWEGLLETGKEILNYTKWVAVSAISFILIQRSLVFIVAALTDLKQVSLLSVGFLFTRIFGLIDDSIRQVLFPKVSELRSGQIDVYKKKIMKIIPLYFLSALVLILVLSVFIYLFLGEKYQESVPIFVVAGSGIAFTSGIALYSILFHTIMKPRPDAFVNVGTLFFAILANFLFVKNYSVIAAVSAYSIILVSGEVVKALILSRYLQGVRVKRAGF